MLAFDVRRSPLRSPSPCSPPEPRRRPPIPAPAMPSAVDHGGTTCGVRGWPRGSSATSTRPARPATPRRRVRAGPQVRRHGHPLRQPGSHRRRRARRDEARDPRLPADRRRQAAAGRRRVLPGRRRPGPRDRRGPAVAVRPAVRRPDARPRAPACRSTTTCTSGSTGTTRQVCSRCGTRACTAPTRVSTTTDRPGRDGVASPPGAAPRGYTPRPPPE